VPTIVAHGDKDGFGKKYKEVFKKLEELDVNHVSMLMKGLGHEFPYGYDEEKGFDRYRLAHDFFDSYLKVEEKLPPVVLMITTHPQSENAKLKKAVSIHFAPEMDAKSITDGKGVQIIRESTNKPLKGSWEIERHSTKFNFTPKSTLKKGEKLKVIISTSVKNLAGTCLAEETIREIVN
jgi:hypothetical protein